MRAFILQPMHVAIVLSLLLHAVLLFCVFSVKNAARKPQLTYTEVHLDTAALYQPAAGHAEPQALNATAENPSMPSSQAAQLPALPPSFRAAENRPGPPAPQVETRANIIQSTDPGRIGGMAITQQLPIPLPGRRPLWSFQGQAMANAQAAYQAQVQRQAGANLQHQAGAARGQYEAYLKGALATLALKSHCKITLPAGSRQQVDCGDEQDIRLVNGVLERFGTIPPMPGDSSPLEIEIGPATTKHSNILG